VLPGAFPLELVLARTVDVMVAVHGGLAYPSGFGFTVSLRRRRPREGPGDDPIHLWHTVRGSEIPPEALRLGIQLGDGSKATVIDGHRWFTTVERPEGPILLQRAGNGSAHSWELGFLGLAPSSVRATGVCVRMAVRGGRTDARRDRRRNRQRRSPASGGPLAGRCLIGTYERVRLPGEPINATGTAAEGRARLVRGGRPNRSRQRHNAESARGALSVVGRLACVTRQTRGGTCRSRCRCSSRGWWRWPTDSSAQTQSPSCRSCG
jgi:hypothetical protein